MAQVRVKGTTRAKTDSVSAEVERALAWLRRHSTRKTREGMARYAIPVGNAFGVSVGDIRRLAKELGRNHSLATGLWKTGQYEARMLACFVDEPDKVTPAQMDSWSRGFDNWAICDTACFHLFDRAPAAWTKARLWSTDRREFVKRAGFALIASLVVHDKDATDAEFVSLLPIIEEGARDDRNFVKKAINWALRTIGKRSPALHSEALKVAKRLATSDPPSCRWVGKDALRELNSAKVHSRLARKRS